MGTGPQIYQAPEWLTAEFLQDVLKEYFKDETLQANDLKVKPVVLNGKIGSLASEMHRATINLVRNDVVGKFSVIIKEHPKGLLGVPAQKNKFFKREILAYKVILPQIELLLASIGEEVKIAPVCYYATEIPEPFLILEDLEFTGYANSENGRLLNLDYVLPTIEKLAKLHASSAFLANQDPEIMQFFIEPPISNTCKNNLQSCFSSNIRCVAEELAQWKGYEEITEKLYIMADNALESVSELYESTEGTFRVFNLGDLWIENLMFKTDNETQEVQDVVLLDYQLAHFGTPAIDLNYFLFGSLNENVRKVHYKFIIHEYHKVLRETLEKLQFDGKIPTLKDISIDIIRNSLQGVIAATCLTPLIFAECNRESLQQLYSTSEEGNRLRKINVQNPKYRTFLQRTVKEFELNGFLDM